MTLTMYYIGLNIFSCSLHVSLKLTNVVIFHIMVGIIMAIIAHTINVWVMDCCISFTQEYHVFNMTVTDFDHRGRKKQMLITF